MHNESLIHNYADRKNGFGISYLLKLHKELT